MNGLFLGVDLGGTKIYTGLAESQGNILGELQVPTGPDREPGQVVKKIAATVRELLNRAGRPVKEVTCLGVGAPGPLNPRTGEVYQAPNLGWLRVPLKTMLEGELGIPVKVDNDANLAALGEYAYGAGAGSGHMFYITVSTGVGGGLILNGEIFHGAGGGAGEVGHMKVQTAGPLCSCGLRGCLEALASGSAMASRARALAGRGGAGVILKEAGGLIAAIDGAAIARAAFLGDAVAMEIIKDSGAALGIGVANIVNLLNPGAVVLGGGAMKIGPLLWESMMEKVRILALEAALKDVKILPAALGDRSGLMGALALAMT